MVEVLGLQFVCHPHVFSPKYFRSTEILNSGFPFRFDETFLEIGPGVGVTTIPAAKCYRNRVVSIDINPQAVDVCRRNALAHGVGDRVDVRQGDLFSPLRDNEKFDTVFWDLPFVLTPENDICSSMLQRDFFDPGYATVDRFLRGISRHVRAGGRIIVSFGTNGDRSRFDATVRELGFRFREVYRGSTDERGGLAYQLLESGAPNRTDS